MARPRPEIKVDVDWGERAIIEAEARRLDVTRSALIRSLVLGAIDAGMSERFLNRADKKLLARKFPRDSSGGGDPRRKWRSVGPGHWVRFDDTWALSKANMKSSRSATIDPGDRTRWWQLSRLDGTVGPIPMCWLGTDKFRVAEDWLSVNS